MNNKIKQITIAIILTLAMIFNSLGMISAETPVPLALTSVSGATVGQTVTLFLTMGANSGLGAATFVITYDPTKLTCNGAALPLASQQSIIRDQDALLDPVTEEPIGGSSSFATNILTPGDSTSSVINTVGFVPGGNLFRIRFTLLPDAAGDMPVTLSVSKFAAATSGNPEIPYTITAQGVISGPEPTPTPIPTETPVPTVTPIPTDTPVPTETPVPTVTPIPTDTPVPTVTPIPTNTPVPTATPTATPTTIPSNTPVPTATSVPTLTVAPTATVQPTAVPTEVVSTPTPGSATNNPDESPTTADPSMSVMLVVVLMAIAATVLAIRRRRYNQ